MSVIDRIERGEVKVIVLRKSDMQGLYDLNKPMNEESAELLRLAKIGAEVLALKQGAEANNMPDVAKIMDTIVKLALENGKQPLPPGPEGE